MPKGKPPYDGMPEAGGRPIVTEPTDNVVDFPGANVERNGIVDDVDPAQQPRTPPAEVIPPTNGTEPPPQYRNQAGQPTALPEGEAARAEVDKLLAQVAADAAHLRSLIVLVVRDDGTYVLSSNTIPANVAMAMIAEARLMYLAEVTGLPREVLRTMEAAAAQQAQKGPKFDA